MHGAHLTEKNGTHSTHRH